MCLFCNSKNKENSCYANFSAPYCNRRTPRTKRYLENDLSAYRGGNTCNCCCNCCTGYSVPYETVYNNGDNSNCDAYPYAKPYCDVPEGEHCF